MAHPTGRAGTEAGILQLQGEAEVRGRCLRRGTPAHPSGAFGLGQGGEGKRWCQDLGGCPPEGCRGRAVPLPSLSCYTRGLRPLRTEPPPRPPRATPKPGRRPILHGNLQTGPRLPNGIGALSERPPQVSDGQEMQASLHSPQNHNTHWRL